MQEEMLQTAETNVE